MPTNPTVKVSHLGDYSLEYTEDYVWVPVDDPSVVLLPTADDPSHLYNSEGTLIGTVPAEDDQTQFRRMVVSRTWLDPAMRVEAIIAAPPDAIIPMTTPCSGAISIQDIRNEFYAGGGPTNLGELGANVLGRPWGQTVSLSEFYCKSAVQPPTSVEYLVVGGGGGGGAGGNGGGGGGAGGMLSGSGYGVSKGSPISVVVGGGGGAGGKGGNSAFGSVVSIGGGFGGNFGGGGNGGGSGGGGGSNGAAGGSGTAGQGNGGGHGIGVNAAGGGGGRGAAGSNAGSGGGNGGAGLASSISGSSVNYAGGGGGSYVGGTSGSGGAGGGGAGTSGVGANGTNGRGGGGGGGVSSGGAGGSGVVIIRYPDTYADPASVTGSPSVTVVGGYKIYTWTAVGSFSITF